MAKDAQNKHAAWQLIRYLVGRAGMKTWTSKGLALPSRKDVKPVAGRAPFLADAPNAHPWQFAPQFSQVIDTANNELSAVIEGKQSISEMLRRSSRPRTARSRSELVALPARPPGRAGSASPEEVTGGSNGDEHRVGADEPRRQRVREALVGYGFIAIPMLVYAVSSSTRSATRSTSAATTGAHSGRSTRSAGRTTTT